MINQNQTNQLVLQSLDHIPVSISVQFEIPKIRKMLKIGLNTKHSIKHHISLFTSKFDTDFSSLAINAFLKLNNQRYKIHEDIPFRFIMANYKL